MSGVEQFKNAISSENIRIFVSTLNGHVNGYIYLLFQDGATDIVDLKKNEKFVIQIASIAVDPLVRAQGLGRLLLAHAEREILEETGLHTVRFIAESDAANRRSLKLLQAADYRQIETLENYYSDGRPAIRLEKIVSGIGPVSAAPAPYQNDWHGP